MVLKIWTWFIRRSGGESSGKCFSLPIRKMFPRWCPDKKKKRCWKFGFLAFWAIYCECFGHISSSCRKQLPNWFHRKLDSSSIFFTHEKIKNSRKWNISFECFSLLFFYDKKALIIQIQKNPDDDAIIYFCRQQFALLGSSKITLEGL